ncbi:adhesion G protein-coupled receptor G3 isoform X1 [Etheostoma spectabile]|uniref:adhesion G protein-coupled receptor G3 isoform X1 n=1 Tax=Etheostoma spectabile TaxID=54343 RepID=UPI0013AF04ED|nr:adhesion G protein-coupled receptor G3-like isoform X1 [Etheostoma spectabile]
MWITFSLVTLAWISTAQARINCEQVLHDCLRPEHVPWTKCYEDRIGSCITGRIQSNPKFIHQRVSWSQKVEKSPTPEHSLSIPASALQRSRGPEVLGEDVLLVTTVINSTLFKLSRTRRKQSRVITPDPPAPSVLGDLVLVVRAGNVPVQNLSQPIKLTFKHNKQVGNGTCVFWEESPLDDGTGTWSTKGCDTHDTGDEFICSCNHMSFFAVLVNPALSVSQSDAVNLSYITYIGSALSVFFTVISLIIYICLQRRRPEKATGVHLQLTGALLCLHLTFLLCSFWVWQLSENEEGWVCKGLGFFLHWSLLATFSWTALEGFHLYLLLVRVFNIYVRRYLLKLSVVGWGVPTLVAAVCGISGVYGKYNLRDANNQTSAAQICWMSSEFPHRLLVSYITTVAVPGALMILCNSCMLGLVVFKLWRLRASSLGTESSGWKKINREKGMKLLKDAATVLGLSCVLGLPWGLASTTYISLPGIYIFTILNSLQGLFMFLWSVALTCKSRSDNDSSVRDPSSQKIMTTSFNN